MEDLERQLDLIAECIPVSPFKAKVEEITAAVKQELADTRASLDEAVETAIANVRAEVANGGTSCHWCLDIAIRKERERCRSIADRIGFAAVNRKDAQSCCAEIAAAIESGE